MYIFDTDALGDIFRYGQQRRLGQRAAQEPHTSLFISVITVEEMLWGRAHAIKAVVKQSNQDERVIGSIPKLCHDLEETFIRLQDYVVLPFDEAAANIYRSIPRATRQGKLNDCRIASVALVHNFTVVTKNTRDFAPIREACGVNYVDWSVAPPE